MAKALNPDVFHFQGTTYRYGGVGLRKRARVQNPLGARRVEIPVALDWLAPEGQRVLEVGNVLNHYIVTEEFEKDVVDLYERFPGVVNVDIEGYRPKGSIPQYDALVSISTVEHFGYGWGQKELRQVPEDKYKVGRCIRHMRSLVYRGGSVVLTFPVGWNPTLDKMVTAGQMDLKRVGFLRKVGRATWEEVGMDEAYATTWGKPLPQANAIVVAELEGTYR